MLDVAVSSIAVGNRKSKGGSIKRRDTPKHPSDTCGFPPHWIRDLLGLQASSLEPAVPVLDAVDLKANRFSQ